MVMIIIVADIALHRALQSKKNTHFHRPFALPNNFVRKWGIITNIFYQENENRSGSYDLQMVTPLADAKKVTETQGFGIPSPPAGTGLVTPAPSFLYNFED